MIVRQRGMAEDLSRHAPALGEDGDRAYESEVVMLAENDLVVALTDTDANAADSVASALVERVTESSRDALSRVMGRTQPDGNGVQPSDVSATVVVRTAPSR